MRAKKIASGILILFGFGVLVTSLVSWMLRLPVRFNSPLVAVVAAFLIAIGVLVLITEMFESWLNRGQAALVDGLQAG
jgi:multisubunit Na+/H+ antiporter MnhE subunit